MGRDFENVLDNCIVRIRSGEMDREGCLRQYPEHADRLRLLLSVAIRLYQKPQPEPRPAAFFAGEQLLNNRLAEKRAAKVMKRGWAATLKDKMGFVTRAPEISSPPRRAWSLKWIATVAGIVAFISVGYGVVAASTYVQNGYSLQVSCV